MKVWVRKCINKGCEKVYGCKHFDEYGELQTRGCNRCLFSAFDKPCFEEDVEVEVTHGICDNCFGFMAKEADDD